MNIEEMAKLLLIITIVAIITAPIWTPIVLVAKLIDKIREK